MALSEKWYSTKQKDRKRKMLGLTLDASTLAALDRKAGGKRKRSQKIEALIREGLGLPPLEVQIGRPASKGSTRSSSSPASSSRATRSKPSKGATRSRGSKARA